MNQIKQRFESAPPPDRDVALELENTRRNMRGRTGALALFGVATASFLGTNAASYYEDLRTMNENPDGPMIENLDGCDPIPITEEEAEEKPTEPDQPKPAILTPEEQETVEKIDKEQSETQSAAQNFNTHGINPIRTMLDLITIDRGQFAEFTSEQSGITFKLHSNVSDPFPGGLDLETMDELIHMPYTDRVTYEQPQIEHIMNCFGKRILEDKEFAGQTINIFIAGDPRTCWKNAIIQVRPKEVGTARFCDSSGGSYDKVRIAVAPGKSLYQEAWSAIFVNSHDPDRATHELSKDIIHEVVGHLFPQMLDLPFRWNPNERFAQELDDDIWKQIHFKHTTDSNKAPHYPVLGHFDSDYFKE